MAGAEDCQLTDLQSEFKRLRVDLNNLCRHKSTIDCCQKSHLGTNKEQSSSLISPLRTEHCKCAKTSSSTKLLSRRKKKRCSKKRPDKTNSDSDLFVLKELVQAVKETVQCSQEAVLDHRLAITYASEDVSQEHSDDTTVDELAGYFDNLVYIPKKMSQMAEMMYT